MLCVPLGRLSTATALSDMHRALEFRSHVLQQISPAERVTKRLTTAPLSPGEAEGYKIQDNPCCEGFQHSLVEKSEGKENNEEKETINFLK